MIHFLSSKKMNSINIYKFIWIFIFIGILINGCTYGNWASQNKTISFLPNVATRLEKESKPILLTENEKKELFSSLRGSVKDDFLNDNLSSDVKIYWYETTKGLFNNAFTIIRFTKDKKTYYSLDYKINGRIISVGGGRVDNSEWIRKWMEE